MRWFILLLSLLCSLSALSQAVAPEAVVVREILVAIDSAKPDTVVQAEARLVALGTPAVPVIREEYAARLAQRAEAERAGRWNDVQLLDLQTAVLDRAAIRLEVGFNPPDMIAQWVKAQTTEANPASREVKLPTPVRLADPALERAYPDYLFYLSRFPRFPVARLVPEPLAANNLFIVRRAPAEGSKNPPPAVMLITEPEALKKFVIANAQQIIKPNYRMTQEGVQNAKKAYVVAWLRLSSELHNDGFFRFVIPAESLQVAPHPAGGTLATGRADVVPTGGNAGCITASLRFDGGTWLVEITETVELQSGMRPICQATKLLDPDPIVRRMAEQDLLVMGPAAWEYLQERRADAAPALQAAIDAIWQRIQTRRY